MERPDERFLAQVKRVRRWARRDLVLRLLVRGLFFGCLAGAVLAILGGTLRAMLPLPLQVPAALAAAAAAAIGAAAGAVVGLARRVTTRELLLRADRALASRELLSAAWELASSSEEPAGGLFRDAILQDAGRLLADSPARLLLGKLRLPLLPFIPPLAALILLASLFPIDLRRLFSGPAPAAREMAVLGGDLEGLGRRLGAAREQDGGRGLELARELERLGRDLQERSVERDEVLDRVEGLRRGLAEQYSLRLKRYPDGPGQRGGGDGSGESEQRSGEDSSSRGQPPSGEASKDREAQDLAEAMKGLDELSDRASGQERREDGDARAGKQGTESDGSGSGADRAGDGAGAEGEVDTPDSREPGYTPVPDRKGPPTRIAESPQGRPLQADSAAGGDEHAGDRETAALKLLVRSLPAWTRAKTPEASVLRDYQRLAEGSLAREEIPVELRPYVKDYFMSIGMGEGSE